MPVNQNSEASATFSDLERWFSQPRMSTFAHHDAPADLYLWNTQITKAFLEDIQHFEVLFRNWLDQALAARYGPRWFEGQSSDGSSSGLRFNKLDTKGVQTAMRRAGGPAAPPGKVVAELTFDFWFHLLDRRHATTIHPIIVAKWEHAHSIEDLKNRVSVIYNLRNRCSHHEPIVELDLSHESQSVNDVLDSIKEVSTWIDRAAGEWITKNSRVADIYQQRP